MHDLLFAFHGLLTCFLLYVCWTDGSRYIIPNWTVGTILALYPAMALTSTETVPWVEGVAMMVAVFVVAFAMFNANVMGGGDAKLLAALGLWAGLQAGLAFLVWMSLYGGVLTLGLLIARRVLAKRGKKGLPPVLERGGKVPYGIAIALGFLTVLWMGQVPGLGVPWSFETLKIE